MTIAEDHPLRADAQSRAFLHELEGAGMTYSAVAGDLDLGTGVRLRIHGKVRRVRRAVGRAGFIPSGSARGCFVAYDLGADVWVRVRFTDETLARVIDAGPRRRGLGVALLAPDGAGKSSTAARLTQSLPLDARIVYLGLFRRADPFPGRSADVGIARRVVRLWRAWLSARAHQRLGRLVLFDRYPYDALLPGGGRLAERVWRWVLGHALPPPDLTIVLDAPGTVLHARSGEHDPVMLERQRQGYLALARQLPRTVVVDASGDREATERAVTRAIWEFYRARHAMDQVVRADAPAQFEPRPA